jgi:A/G-specific adenine glycosylase
LPWRATGDPYAVWVSEVMLQQTQVATVVPYYERFLKRFPTVRRLAAASLEDVLRVWQGLGYYSRARNLHRAARQVVGAMGGRLPECAAEWRRLPGVGDYTAAAIASIGFGEPRAVVDGNVARVMARFRGLRSDFGRAAARRALVRWLDGLIPADAPGAFNQALMELGALVCRPTRPDCGRCPLATDCVARREDRTGELPVRRRRPGPVPMRLEVACVVVDRGRVLCVRRPERGMLGGLYGLPTGPLAASRPATAVAARLARQRFGVEVAAVRSVGTVEHAYSHFRLRLRVVACRREAGRVQGLRGQRARWIPLTRLGEFAFDVAARRALERFMRTGAATAPG